MSRASLLSLASAGALLCAGCEPAAVGSLRQGLGAARIQAEPSGALVYHSLLDLPEPVTAPVWADLGFTAYHAYSWDFGDCSPPSFDGAGQHVYARAGTYRLTATVTGIKETDELAARTSWAQLTTEVTVSAAGTPAAPPAPPFSGAVAVGPALRALADGTVVADAPAGGVFADYVVRLAPGVPAGSVIELSLPRAHLYARAELLPTSCRFRYELSEGADVYTVRVSDVRGGEAVHVPVLGRPGLPDGALVRVGARVRRGDGVLLGAAESAVTVAGSVDPNDKRVEIAAGGLRRFALRFENVGAGLARRAWVVDALPRGLDLATLRVEAVEAPGVGRVEAPPLQLVRGLREAGPQGYEALNLGPVLARRQVAAALDPDSRRLLVVVASADLRGAGAAGPSRSGRVVYTARREAGAAGALRAPPAVVYFDNVNNGTHTDAATVP